MPNLKRALAAALLVALPLTLPANSQEEGEQYDLTFPSEFRSRLSLAPVGADAALRLFLEAKTPEEHCHALNRGYEEVKRWLVRFGPYALPVLEEKNLCNTAYSISLFQEPKPASNSAKMACVAATLRTSKSYCREETSDLGTRWVPKSRFARSGWVGHATDGENIKAGEKFVVEIDNDALMRLGSGDTFQGTHIYFGGGNLTQYHPQPVPVEGRVLSPYFSWWPGARLVELTMIELQGEMHSIKTSEVSAVANRRLLPEIELLEDVEVRAEELRTERRAEELRTERREEAGRLDLGVVLDLIPVALRSELGRNTGAYVAAVEDESPAFFANLLVGDVIIGVAGEEVRTPSEFEAVLESVPSGPVELTLIRGREKLELRIDR